MKTIVLIVTTFLAGLIPALLYKRNVLQNTALDHHIELNNMHHKAFMSGWENAVGDPTITYEHYLKFKSDLEETISN